VKFGQLGPEKRKEKKKAKKGIECLASTVSRQFFLRVFFLLV
jgi:hypothetical protein